MRKRLLPWVLLLVAVSLPYWFIQTQYQLSVATYTLIWMALGIAWNIISGFGNQISFGHSVYFGIGAYAVILLYNGVHLTPWLGMLVAGLLAAVFSLSMVVVFRLQGIYFALATFAVTLIFQNLAVHFSKFTGGDVGLSVPLLGNNPAEFQFNNPLIYYFIVLAFVAIFFIAALRIYHSRLGLYLRSVGNDQDAAAASGVPVLRVKVMGLFVSAFMTGVMGAVYMQVLQFIDPASGFGYATATQIVILPLAGGLGTIWGPVVGAAVFYPLQQLLNNAFTFLPAGFGLIAYGAILIIVMSTSSEGLYGSLVDLYNWLVMQVSRMGAREERVAAK